MSKIEEGVLAVKLTGDVSGGLGEHKAGTTLRNLSPSAFNTLVHGGFGEALKSGDVVRKEADAAAAPAPVG